VYAAATDSLRVTNWWHRWTRRNFIFVVTESLAADFGSAAEQLRIENYTLKPAVDSSFAIMPPAAPEPMIAKSTGLRCSKVTLFAILLLL
jgi:hypothetical protein